MTKLFLLSKGLVYANRTNNSELKNWLYNNLGNICFDKKEYKRFTTIKSHLITAKELAIQYKLFLQI
jgi:hypothetical protein